MPRICVHIGNGPERTRSALLLHPRHANCEDNAEGRGRQMIRADPIRPADRVRSSDHGEPQESTARQHPVLAVCQ
eukprot:5635425-Pyramimonas_sp.AAC.1